MEEAPVIDWATLLPTAWPIIDNFVRPDWQQIFDHIDTNYSEESRQPVDRAAVLFWLHETASALGSQYQVLSSAGCYVLTARNRAAAEDLLLLCEAVQDEFIAAFQLPSDITQFVPVVMVFETAEEYYNYMAHFYPEGSQFAPSGGIYLSGNGFPHVAIPDVPRLEVPLTHELMHATLAPMELPQWLEEGMLRIMERRAGHHGTEGALEERDRRQHLRFWNPDRIEDFWSGASFSQPGPAQKLSYSLAEVLVTLLLEQHRDTFPHFLHSAHRSDAGEESAQEVFGTSLGNVVGDFLGENDWAPKGRAIGGLT